MGDCSGDTEIIASIIGAVIGGAVSGISSIAVVLFDRSRTKKDQKNQDLDLFKKIFTDIFNGFKDQISIISAQVDTNTISKKPIDELSELIKIYNNERLRMYTVDDDKFRLKLSNAIKDISELIEKATEIHSSLSLKEDVGISDSFKESLKSNYNKCEDIVNQLKSVA